MAVLGKAILPLTAKPYSDGSSLGRHMQIHDTGHAYRYMHMTLFDVKFDKSIRLMS